jgi:hypothetical protein
MVNVCIGTSVWKKTRSDRKSMNSAQMMDNIWKFIINLNGRESHYTSAKPGPICWSPYFLFMYFAECTMSLLRGSESHSFNAVINDFNISLRYPVTDTCSICTHLEN